MSNLSEEEKQAIDTLQNCIADYVIEDFCVGKYCPQEDACKNDDCPFEKAIDTVINLIDKQQKEIERQRELNVPYYIDNKSINEWADELVDVMTAENGKPIYLSIGEKHALHIVEQYVRNSVSKEDYDELQEEIKYLKSQIPQDKIFYYSEKNFVSKDKIKEEIKELDEMNVDGEVFTTAVNFTKKILKELLGEEDE